MIVAIGDSITYAEHLPREQAWTTLLSEMLGEPVVNEGVCSDTTRLGLERFPKAVQERRPDTVIIQFGANDANRWWTDEGLCRVSIDAFQANLNEMIDRCEVVQARTIVLCTIARSRKHWQLSMDCAAYSRVIRCVAYESGAYHRNKAMLFDAEALGELSYLDGLHLDAAANRRYAEGLAEVLAGVPA